MAISIVTLFLINTITYCTTNHHGNYKIFSNYFHFFVLKTFTCNRNFHVWNEAWMKRPDLNNYVAWQAVDSTPEVISDGLYRSGPTSKTAVKMRELDKPYDTVRVFTSVNARQIMWWYDTYSAKYKSFVQPGR